MLEVGAVLKARFPEARCFVVSGSIVRGQGTATSDYDCVVEFARVDPPWRETFEDKGRLYEAFCHDPEASHWVLGREADDGRPVLAHMLATGIVVPVAGDDDPVVRATHQLVSIAKRLLAAGPPPLEPADLDRRRYFLTAYADDARDAKNRGEELASLMRMYDFACNLFLRLRGHFEAGDKWVPRSVLAADPSYGREILAAFDDAFAGRGPDEALRVTAEILRLAGGPLQAGWRAQGKTMGKKPLTPGS